MIRPTFLPSVLLLLSLFLCEISMAQDKYFIRFSDRNGTSFSLSNPFDYLSARAINRRTVQGIAIDSSDLPVNQSYIQAVANTGALVLHPVKWHNGVLIEASNPAILSAVLSLPFVVSGSVVARPGGKWNKEIEHFSTSAAHQLLKTTTLNYGNAYAQSDQIGLIPLHNSGFTGNGMLIAVLDAGYFSVNTMTCFDSLFAQNRIVATYDFVDRENDVFDDHDHGSTVLSVMAAHVPGDLIGVAPHASYLLLRSEDVFGEKLIEEYYWSVAAEFADSSGADIINSSLGYSLFDDPAQNHSYSDMDGTSTPAALSASKATEKGILVVNSAGNEGVSNWNYITTPADAWGILAVGAVDEFAQYAPFSSNGPSADGRIKPEICSRGANTWLYTPFSSGSAQTGNGTSFAAPLIAGAAACLWQQWPGMNVQQIRQAILQSASIYTNPDTALGYGIPNFSAASSILGIDFPNGSIPSAPVLFPNPLTQGQHPYLLFKAQEIGSVDISLYSAEGRGLYQLSISTIEGMYYSLPFPEFSNYSAGVYLLQLKGSRSVQTTRLVIQ